MKDKTKRIISITLKTAWALIGLLIGIMTIYWYIFAASVGELGGTVIGSILFGYSLTAFLIYLGITVLYIVLKLIIKSVKKLRKK